LLFRECPGEDEHHQNQQEKQVFHVSLPIGQEERSGERPNRSGGGQSPAARLAAIASRPPLSQEPPDHAKSLPPPPLGPHAAARPLADDREGGALFPLNIPEHH
jgi:hypothetical protein